MSGPARYETILRLASGGMATVWIGTVRGALGFRQLVAIKKPHPHILMDPGFRGELVAEARLASMIRHANVVDVRDVEIDGESISLIMDYIEGASLGDLLVSASKREAAPRIPARVAVRIVRDACAGLHAAHELVDERDRPVGLVHRDVSPQNVLVGTDGISRVTDFGVAKFSRKNMQSTSEGSLKGKIAYMAPEYVRGEEIDRRFDVFALGIVLWEALTGKRCFRGDNEADTMRRLLDHTPDPVSKINPELEPLDGIVACALAKKIDERFQNAAAMGAALEGAATAANLMGSHTEVAAVLKELVGPAIAERRTLIRAKLANEPSVASLMGHPPLGDVLAAGGALPPTVGTPPQAAAPTPAAATLIDASPTLPAGGAPPPPPPTTQAAATPKMGGAPSAPSAAPSTATSPVMSAVPSTQPMTPPLGAMPSPTTLASALPIASPNTAPPAVITWGSGSGAGNLQASPTGSTLRSEDDSNTNNNIGTAVAVANTNNGYNNNTNIHASSESAENALSSAFPVSPPPRRSLVPFVIGALVVVVGVVVLIMVARSKRSPDVTTTTTASSSSGEAASATASSAVATPAVSASTATIATTMPTPPKTTTTRSTAGGLPTGGPRPTPTTPTPSASLAPTSSGTAKKPPKNPYE